MKKGGAKEELMSTNEKLIRIFEYALHQEETGKSFFQTSLQRMGIGAAVSAFKRLIEEEEKHILFITKILNDLKQKGEIKPLNQEKTKIPPTDFFDERSRSEFLQQCLEGSMVPEVTVFNTAWLIEKDLSDFYEEMSKQTEGRAKEAFKMLSSWEREHEKFFREYRDKFSEIYSTMPWGG
jgi:rubrerythrin